MTPSAVLAAYPDRTRPLLTQYSAGESAGEWRMELSVATVGNAVAKAANLLRDGLGLGPGSTMSVDLPLHWQLPIWTLAGLSVGASCGRELDLVDVRVVGPAGLARMRDGAVPGAADVVACSCDAFGRPLAGDLPPNVLDAAEVRSYGDRFAPEPAAPGAAALHRSGRFQPWSELTRGSVPATGARVWVDESIGTADLLWRVVASPMLRQASVVMGTGLSAERAAVLRVVEGVTEWAT